jgi:single-stranded DNA-binding protein
LAVNRTCRRSDYVPCIAWDRNAKYTANFGCGKHLRVNGRIQSRDYKKVNENGDVESRTAYEVSISSFDELGGDTVAREEM